ncbi:phosphodiester glycosidase family protein [Candidatus Synechococcus calcipolaris G9]|uniref:Phosphodiester glycosidase family protein n=1 Tax=Candidatus Synechococcus calcipolaris G9 TaxID=1497997 RepID=A0ABT6EW63_9SYNE|nr:phosphodiester glycosidase family protein [Candidatus Synechococcus calcipolaris]MDG2989749.1 phosphodiester glycosidase family protein [Candidatus Synechococcus calcipolaris G9]
MLATLVATQVVLASQIAPGVHYSQHSIQGTAVYFVAAQMDQVNVVMTSPNSSGTDTYLETTESFARRNNTLAAINTNFYQWIQPGQVNGFNDYQRWIRGTLDIRIPYADLRQTCLTGQGTIPSMVEGAYFVNGQQVRPHRQDFGAIVNFPAQGGMEFYQGELPSAPHHVIAGQRHLILNGQPQHADADNHPKTIVGRRQNEYVFLVADGRGNNGSPGVSFAQLQQFLLDRGVTDATALDGGDSSTLVVHGDVKNYPQDTHCAFARLIPSGIGNFAMTMGRQALGSALSSQRSLRPTGANLGLVPRSPSVSSSLSSNFSLSSTFVAEPIDFPVQATPPKAPNWMRQTWHRTRSRIQAITGWGRSYPS